MLEQKEVVSPLFRSFWLAGFESGCQITQAGRRLDMIAVTQHDSQVAGDYARLREVGIQAARDGIRWHLIERSGRYDFSSLAPMVQAAREYGIQVIWNICHYGWPDDLDIFAPAFVDRFARFCRAVARFMADQSDEVPFYTPINELSFLSWAAGTKGYIYPCAHDRGHELKRQLVRAVIAGCEAIWEVDPRARFVHVDPLIHVVAPRGRPELADAAAGQRAGQFESWDMLAGYAHPDLGGSPRYLDIMGFNFYHSNQWEFPGEDESARLRWEDTPRDERWVPLHKLLAEVYQHYQRPLFLSETSHFGVGRGPWIAEIAVEVGHALAAGVPIEGICIYPILDRPDWDNLEHWHNSGLWDLVPGPDGQLRRVICPEYVAELQRAQALLAQATRHYKVVTS